MGWRNFTGEVNKNGISCKFADIEDFDEIQKLYWDLIEQSKDEPSFPGLNNLVLIAPPVQCKVSHFIYNCFCYG